MFNNKIINDYLIENTNIYSEEQIESIHDMLNRFEGCNVISSDKKEYYKSILEYCNTLDSKYNKK